MKKNIDAWKDAGGIGILYTSASAAINKLKNLLTDIEKEASFIGIYSIEDLLLIKKEE